MDYAEKIVDSVVMINRGQKVLDGALSDIKARYGKRFVMVNYEGDSAFVNSLDYVNSCKDYGKEMEIELLDLKYKEKLLKELVSRLSINYFRIAEPSLNNIFIRKVQEEDVLTPDPAGTSF
jgi:ABC-2 type transport system ATP-binding protein